MPTIELDRYVEFSIRLAELCCRWMLTAERLDREGNRAAASQHVQAIRDVALAFPELDVGMARLRDLVCHD